MNNKIIQDLWYHYVENDVEPFIIIYCEIDNKEYELAHISMPNTSLDTLNQEDTYNLCLEVAHDLGYYLEGEVG